MAIKKQPHSEYIPSYETRETVARMVAHNFSMDTIMQYIVNPDTGQPLSRATFEKVFAEEMRTARIERVEAVSSVIFDKAMSGDLQAARTIINLQGRGLFNKKFELDTSKSPQEQIDSVLNAASRSLISAEDITHYCNAIKLKTESTLDKIIALLKTVVDSDTINQVLGIEDKHAG